MTQALYAHMNKRKVKKRKEVLQKNIEKEVSL
jgi:hypothetical protein